VNARRIINGTDKAATIAAYYDAFVKALKAAGHVPGGVVAAVPVVPVTVAPLPAIEASPLVAPAPRRSADPSPPEPGSTTKPEPGLFARIAARLRAAYPRKDA